MSTANKILMGASGAGGAVGPSDDEFNRVSFLSHFDGANNGVNNAFDDGSASNHTITANGDVTQGSFGPFARPDGEWGVSFDGDDYLTVAASNDFDVSDGDITIEGFFNFTSTAVASALWTLSIDNDDTNGIRFQRQTTGFLRFDVRSGDSYVVNVTDDTISLPLNTWHHVAVTRTSGGDWKVYVNGVIAISATESASSPDTSGIPLSIGANYRGTNTFMNGHISNFRVVKGTLVYTSNNFTPPTGKLTAITNTKLLTCQSNRFVDNSASAHTVTPSGNPAVSAFGPFLTSAVYDPAVNGASAYFDGDGDYLSAPQIISQSGNFTIEGWVYTTSTDASQVVCGGEAGPLRMVIESSGGNIKYFQDNVGTYTGSSKESLNQWCHFVAMRTGSNQAFYVNGTRVFNETAANMYEGNFYIGNTLALSYYHFGYISNIRCTASAVYSEGTSITVPTAPYSTVTNTNLLLNMADAQAIDSAAQNNITLGGNANTSTDQAKFGDTSLHLDGTTDYAEIVNVQGFGTGDFTIEGFYRFASFTSQGDVFDFRTALNSALPLLYLNNSGELKYYLSGAVRIQAGSGNELSTNTWYHIALCRGSGSTKLFVDGTQVGSTYSDSITYLTAPIVRIGARSYGATPDQNIDGFVDDFRISRMALYTGNFTAPSEPFPDKGQ